MHKPLSPMSHRAHIGLRFTETPLEGGETPPDGGSGGSTPPKQEARTFTQAEVNEIAAREKKQGKAAAEQSLAEQLGVTLAEAKQIIADQRAAADSTKTEAQKDRDAAAREKQEAENERQTVRKEVHDTRLERAFDKVGVDLSDTAAKEKNLRLLRMVTVEIGATYDEILADVKKIQTDFPGLFGTTEQAPPGRRAPGGDPQGTPPKRTPGESKYDAGRKRAQAQLASKNDQENPLVKASQR